MEGFIMKRYYELLNGKVKGSYTVPQPDKELELLDEAPDDESMWDGAKWIPDPDIVAAEQAAAEAAAKAQAELDAKIAAIADAKVAVASLETAVEKATDLEGLKKIVLDLIKNVQVLSV